MSDLKLGLKFGLPAQRMLQEKIRQFPHMLREIEGGAYDVDETGVAYILYFGYLNNCMIKEVAPVLKYENFIEHLSDYATNAEKKTEVLRIVKVWADAQDVKDVTRVQNDAAAEGKKKVGSGPK